MLIKSKWDGNMASSSRNQLVMTYMLLALHPILRYTIRGTN
jgi:hypothetical protein